MFFYNNINENKVEEILECNEWVLCNLRWIPLYQALHKFSIIWISFDYTNFFRLHCSKYSISRQGQLQIWTEHSHTDLWNLKPVEISKNIQILFSCHLGAKLVKRNLRIALINFLVMRFISNFDISFYSRVLLKSKRRGL